MPKGAGRDRIVEGIHVLGRGAGALDLRLGPKRKPRARLPLDVRTSAPALFPALAVVVAVEAGAKEPPLVGIGVQLEVPFHAGLVHHQRPSPGATVAEGARIVRYEPSSGGEVAQLIQAGKEQPGPG